MQILPKVFRKYGYDYKQVIRNNKTAIYKQFDNDVTYYEVIRIKHYLKDRIAKFKKNGKIIESIISKGEYYPSNEEWGGYGWTYMDLTDAKNKFEKLNKQKRVILGDDSKK